MAHWLHLAWEIFWFFYAFVPDRVRSPYGTDERTDGRTDKTHSAVYQDGRTMRLVKRLTVEATKLFLVE